jgi:tetratricopeptide (TPR) repeat protein
MSASAQPPGGDDATQATIRALYKSAVGQIQAAQQGSGADRWGSAIEGFNRVVDLAPGSPLGYLGRGWARALAGDDELALEDLGRAIQVGTELPQVYATRARFFETHGQLAKALEDYDEAVARSSRDAQLLSDRAAVRLAQRDWKGALDDLTAALEIQPGLVDVRRMRAGILESQQRHEEAIADLDVLIGSGQDDAAVYRDRGNSRGALGDHAGAIADFTAAIERDPSLADAYLARAYAHACRNEDEEAVADYTRALQLDETLIKAYRRRGEAFLRLGKPEQALPDLNRFLELGADSPEAFTLRARAREGVGDISGALADYTHAVESDSTALPAYLGRGRVQLTRGHPELSLSDYDAAVSIDPSSTDAYIGRAAAYQALGDAEQAAWDHQRAAALDPARVEAHRGLVLADLATGEEYQDRRLVGKADETYRSALEHAERGLSVAAGDRVLRTCRAAALRALGACDRALDEIRALIDEGPADDAEAGRLQTEAGHTLLQWGRLTRRPELIDEALSQLDGPADGPDGAAALELAGTALAELGRHEEALERFATAAERAPNAPGVLLGMGSAYLRLGESSEALAAFARLLQHCAQRDRIERWARVGRAVALGRLPASGTETGLTRALRRPDDDAVSHVERGSRLEFFGALDEAEQDFQTAVRLAPTWGTVHHVLALLLIVRADEPETPPDVRTARLEEATRLAGYAIERHKIGAAEPYYRQTAGRAYLLLGRTGEALEHLRRAAEVNPDHVGMRADLEAAESAAQS